MVRKIIEIDENLCNGCGECVPHCAEGALRIIDGKARLVSDLFCDGLGACLGQCPVGAIEVIEREAPPYDERRVMEENIVPAGANTIKAHLEHLRDHGETGYLEAAEEYLREKSIPNPVTAKAPASPHAFGGCPGSRSLAFGKTAAAKTGAPNPASAGPSALSHWPIQLHLANPVAPHYRDADLLLAADCTAFAAGGFHGAFLAGRALAIACPKLDDGLDVYEEKIRRMIDEAGIKSLTVLIMQVPCCGGLAAIAQRAAQAATLKIPVKKLVLSLQGQVLSEESIAP